MALKQTLPIPAETAIASYNFTDIASGTGYVTFFGIEYEDDTHGLSPNQVTSEEYRSASTGTGGTALREEFDFDTEAFNLPRHVKGDLLVTEAYACSEAGTPNTTVFTKVRIFHVASDSTETEIGTQITTDTITSSSDANLKLGKRTTIKFTVDKLFKKGEKLRVNIEVHGSGGSGNSRYYLYHSGDNKGTGPTEDDSNEFIVVDPNLIISIPFEIDI